MIKDLQTAALGMQNMQTRLEVVANNIANVNTTGYKKANVFERNLVDAKAKLFNVAEQTEQSDSPIGSYLDWTAGAYSETNNRLDVAIEGSGFFVLRDAAGIHTLTRAGNFQLNAEGFLTSADGHYVIGTDEDAIQIPDYALINNDANNSNKLGVSITISKTGEIYANDVNIGTLLIVDCSDYSGICQQAKQSYTINNVSLVHPVANDSLNLKQGWLENSNVNIIDEMVKMIELQRSYETGSKVIQTTDNTLEKSIQTAKFGYY